MALNEFSQFRQHRNDTGLTEYWGTAAPSAATELGPFKLGDVVWNTAPAGGGATYMGWVCTSAGDTGATSTWKGFGLIEI